MTSRSAPQRIGLLAALAGVAGLLVAGLLLPLVGAADFFAKHAASSISNTALPAYFQSPAVAQRSVLYAADGTTVLATVSGSEDRVVVTADQIPVVMKKAIVAIEDNRFYEHNGVDLRGVLRAAKADSSSGDFTQGASTITEQYVKLVELERASTDKGAQQAATEKSLQRKVRDARYALALEKTMSKDAILTNYLNIAYFGEGVYGVGTAAEHYFQVPVAQLTLPQAALLAGLVNNPTGFDPVQHPRAAQDRRNAVLEAVKKYGFLPQPQVDTAIRTPVSVHPVTKNVDACASSAAPNYCRFALDQLYADPKVGSDKVLTGGLKIITGWDPRIQNAADAAMSARVPDTARQVLASVVEQPGTGIVTAISQNRGYGTGPGQSKQVFAAIPAYQVGSTFKAITLTAAVDQGIPLTTAINSPQCLHLGLTRAPGTQSSCPDGIRNAGDSESGVFDLYSGTWASVNTFYVQLEKKVGGPGAVAAMATKLGVAHGLASGKYGLSLTLGAGDGFSAIDIANVYATLDAHGLACTPTGIVQITGPTGSALNFTHPACKQAVSANTADTVTSVLQGVLTEPGATARGLSIGRPAAAKTGTVDNGNEAWFVGYIPQYVAAVGLFDPTKLGQSAAPICDDVSGRCFTPNDLFGASISGPTWQSLMRKIAAPLDVQDFALPQAYDTGHSQVTSSPSSTGSVPNVVGLPVASAEDTLRSAGYGVRVQSLEVDSSAPKDSVVGQSPGSGSNAQPGSTVTLILSNGRGAGQTTTVIVTPTNKAPPSTGPTKK